MKMRPRSGGGFTLIELVLVIVVIGVLATIAVRSLSPGIDTAKHQATLRELDQLAEAIAGSQNVFTNGHRVHFGYVGDVGSLPSNLNDLAVNPGYTTWNGPYIESGSTGTDFSTDAWGAPYQLLDTILRSTGSGANIDKQFAGSTGQLLENRVHGTVVDADRESPTAVYVDSVSIELDYPDGSGSITTETRLVGSDGAFEFPSVPVGNHRLRTIWLPEADTVEQLVTVYPGRTAYLELTFPADIF